MKNLIRFFTLRSSLRVNLQILLGLIINLCSVNQSNAQLNGGQAWCYTNQLYPDNSVYYVCTSENPIVFYISADETSGYNACTGSNQAAILLEMYGYLNGTMITLTAANSTYSEWTYSLDPSTLTPGTTYDVSFYPEYYYESCFSWNSELGQAYGISIHILTPDATPSLTINSSTQLCPNTDITFYPYGTPYLSGNTPSFIWQKNGIDIVGQTGQNYTTNTLVAGDVITCEMTSSNTCLNTPTVVSNPMTINNPLTPSLSISSNPAPDSSICPNTNITFSANAINTGSNPGYSWYINGVSISNAGSSFTRSSNGLLPTDVITCNMYTGNLCVTTLGGTPSTNSLTFSNLQPKAQVVFPTGANRVCMNSSTQLSVNNVNGTSTYIWQKLSNNVWTTIAGETGSSYTTPPLKADTSYRYIRNNSLCGIDTSKASTIIVNVLPDIDINPPSANIVNGDSVTLYAYNRTSYPVSYSWSPALGLNTTIGAAVIANPSITTTYAVTATGTNGCSKTIYIPVTVSDSIVNDENSLRFFPNPADKNIVISVNTSFSKSISFTISDILGKTMTQWDGKLKNGVYENEISIENLSQGVYFLSVKIGERIITQKFVKE